MSENKEETKGTDKKAPLSLRRPGTLEIKKTVEGGQVRQSFSHGRSKVVAVEVRKKRSYALDSGGKMAAVKPGAEAPEGQKAVPTDADSEEASTSTVARVAGATLTTEEKAVRARALEDAQKAADQAELDPAKHPLDEAEDEEKRREAAAAEEARATEEAERLQAAEGEARRQADEEARRREERAKAAAAVAAAKLKAVEGEGEEAEGAPRGRHPGRPEQRRPAPAAARRGQQRRRSGKLTISEALGDRDERTRSLASVKRAREREKQKFQLSDSGESQKIFHEVIVPETITVQELANRMAERGAAVIKSLMTMGVMATVNQTIDADTAELVVTEFGHTIKRVSESDVEIGLKGDEDAATHLEARAPVVTVMGHVDHGKTSLLDALRKATVADHEAGGITQHIGAYQVTNEAGRKITFIDTPGHAAFTEMRARGAKSTDIVVLVVAADDGIMPQTVEAIHHAQAAEVPMIVAINKMDRPDADAGRVRTELLQHDVVLEEMGGEILSVEISAKEQTNLDKLEEIILLQAELLDLKANPERAAEGVIIEAKMEPGRGPVATALVQRGTLKVGDIFVAGSEWGRARALVDDHGQSIDEAGPSVPVEILGLTGTPAAGDDLSVVESEARAREVTDFRRRRERDIKVAATGRGTLDQMFERIQEGEAETLPVVVKADAHGSVEAIVGTLEKLATDEVKVLMLHAGVGGINESDVTLARASKALIVGFNVRANRQARDLAKRDNVEIRYYSIIYNVTDDLKAGLSGLLKPTLREKILGSADIREVFAITKVGKVAGCMVTEGHVRRGAKVRLLRDDVVVHEGSLSQLKRFKDDVREVKDGTECGMAFENYQDIQAGDTIECFEVEEVAREL
jgi:translation initiation factor IF-2